MRLKNYMAEPYNKEPHLSTGYQGVNKEVFLGPSLSNWEILELKSLSGNGFFRNVLKLETRILTSGF